MTDEARTDHSGLRKRRQNVKSHMGTWGDNRPLSRVAQRIQAGLETCNILLCAFMSHTGAWAGNAGPILWQGPAEGGVDGLAYENSGPVSCCFRCGIQRGRSGNRRGQEGHSGSRVCQWH